MADFFLSSVSITATMIAVAIPPETANMPTSPNSTMRTSSLIRPPEATRTAGTIVPRTIRTITVKKAKRAPAPIRTIQCIRYANTADSRDAGKPQAIAMSVASATWSICVNAPTSETTIPAIAMAFLRLNSAVMAAADVNPTPANTSKRGCTGSGVASENTATKTRFC